MPLIYLIGPHAVGKTTAAQRYVSKYQSKLTMVMADLTTVQRGETKAKEKGWNGTTEDKCALLRKYRALSEVVAVETARSDMLRGYRPGETVFILTCPGEVLKRNLISRCEAKGKKFRADYWDDKRLDYESSRRYINFAQANLRPSDVLYFTISDYEQDWPKVDAKFSELFRTLNNQLIRSRHA